MLKLFSPDIICCQSHMSCLSCPQCRSPPVALFAICMAAARISNFHSPNNTPFITLLVFFFISRTPHTSHPSRSFHPLVTFIHLSASSRFVLIIIIMLHNTLFFTLFNILLLLLPRSFSINNASSLWQMTSSLHYILLSLLFSPPFRDFYLAYKILNHYYAITHYYLYVAIVANHAHFHQFLPSLSMLYVRLRFFILYILSKIIIFPSFLPPVVMLYIFPRNILRVPLD